MPKNGSSQKIGRNQPCPCGSGLKYKKCCLTSGRSPSAAPERWLDESEAPLVEVEVRTVGAARVRELLGDNRARGEVAELRWFVVLETVPGFGVFVAELDAEGEVIGDSQWVESEEASYVFDTGNAFAYPHRPGDPIRIPPHWETCPECQERIAAGRRQWRAAAV